MKRCVGLFVFIFLFSAIVPSALSAPVSYITERSEAEYFPNGTLRGNASDYGYVEVYVGNTRDVLQQVEMILSSTDHTNILSNTGRKNVAASPGTAQRTRIYLNTTDNERAIEYEINDSSVISRIALRSSIRNLDGGSDLHANDTNSMEFTIYANSTRQMSDVDIILQLALNTYETNDAMEIYGESATSGTTNLMDTDSDTMPDRLEWNLDMGPGVEYELTFYGNVTPDENFDWNFMYLDFDGLNGLRASHVHDTTMTGMSFSDRFSRGPVRQGVEIINSTTWATRGSLENTASGLDYIVHGWDLYELGDPNPVLSSSADQTIAPGENIKTEWYDTGSTELDAYFSTAFKWEVVWGGSIYMQYSDSRVDFLPFYAIDLWGDKTITMESNSEGSGSVLRVSDTARHIGHSSLPAKTVNLTSSIPYLSSDGTTSSWDVSNVTVTYVNGSGNYDITSGSQMETRNSDGSTEGYVKVSADMFTVLGHGLEQNEDVVVSYDLRRESEYNTRTYDFDTGFTLTTESGTPVTRTVSGNFTVPGIGVPPAQPTPGGEPAGPGVVYEEYYADIVKESSSVKFIADDYVDVNVTSVVMDSGTKGIKDVKMAVYIPEGGDLEESEFRLHIYQKSENSWTELVRNEDFTLKYGGLRSIGEIKYREYLVEKKEEGLYREGFLLKDGDRIKADYKATIPHGVNYILTRTFGYNYYKDSIMFEDSYTPVRREINIVGMKVSETEWKPSMVVSGEPVKWTKEFSVYNPNNVSVSEVMFTELFPDTMTADIVEYRDSEVDRSTLQLRMENMTYVKWVAKADGLSTERYSLEITTPPVIKTNETISVIETGEALVVFRVNTSLKNFALEDYQNVSFFIPLNGSKMLSISNGLEQREEDEGIYVTIPSIPSGESANFSYTYRETPPVMVTSMNALGYSCHDSANITIYVIPSEDFHNSYLEFEVIGPSPKMKTKYADMFRIGEAEEFEEVRIPVTLDVFSMPSGKYFTYSKFREGFATLLTDRKEFTVKCDDIQEISLNWVIILAICAVIVAYVILRIQRKKTYKAEVSELKKKLEDIE